MSFAGMRVLALESRRSNELAELIRRQGGEPVMAQSMREAPVESNDGAFQFAERLFAGGYDMVIFMTGVGTRALSQLLETHYPPETFADALRKVTVVARGPKPAAALREMNVPVKVTVPEPNTSKEILAVLTGRPERHIAIQEYGRPSTDLAKALEERGAEVDLVPVYQYAMPEDLGPLRNAVEQVASQSVQAVLFTTATQVTHLLKMAATMKKEADVIAGLGRAVIASIGPSTSEALSEHGLKADMMPTRPKMGFLVKEGADQAPAILASKRA